MRSGFAQHARTTRDHLRSRAVQTPALAKPRRNHFAQVSINGRAPVRMLVANVG